MCWGHRYLKTNKKWSKGVVNWKMGLSAGAIHEQEKIGRASQSNTARRDMWEGPKVRPRSRGRTRVGVVKSTNLDFKWGQVGNELKKKKPVVCHVPRYDVSQW